MPGQRTDRICACHPAAGCATITLKFLFGVVTGVALVQPIHRFALASSGERETMNV